MARPSARRRADRARTAARTSSSGQAAGRLVEDRARGVPAARGRARSRRSAGRGDGQAAARGTSRSTSGVAERGQRRRAAPASARGQRSPRAHRLACPSSDVLGRREVRARATAPGRSSRRRGRGRRADRGGRYGAPSSSHRAARPDCSAPGRHLHQRALAGAVLADQGVDLARAARRGRRRPGPRVGPKRLRDAAIDAGDGRTHEIQTRVQNRCYLGCEAVPARDAAALQLRLVHVRRASRAWRRCRCAARPARPRMRRTSVLTPR